MRICLQIANYCFINIPRSEQAVSKMGLLTQAFLFLRENWIFLVLAPIAFHLLYNKYGHGLSKIPGPFWASTSDIWLLVHYTRRRGLTERQMHEKYNSPLLRLGPNTVSVSDPEAIRVIYGWKPVFKKVIIRDNIIEWDSF